MPVSGKRKSLAPKPHYTIYLFEDVVLTQNMHFGKTTHLSLFENKVKRNLDFFFNMRSFHNYYGLLIKHNIMPVAS